MPYSMPGSSRLQRMSGCFASVMGLPLCHLLRLFEQLGLEQDRTASPRAAKLI